MGKFIGSDYAINGYRNIKEVASLVRNDIKVAKQNGMLPKGLKATVSIKRFSGGKSLTVKVKKDSISFLQGLTFEKIWEDDTIQKELKAIEASLYAIMNEYNYIDSDSMSDYFSTSFFTHVCFDRGQL